MYNMKETVMAIRTLSHELAITLPSCASHFKFEVSVGWHQSYPSVSQRLVDGKALKRVRLKKERKKEKEKEKWQQKRASYAG